MILGFCGESNSGKTTIIEKLIERFRERYSIAVVKHTPHGVDVQGKDSRRFRDAGAREVILLGDEEVRFKEPDSLFKILHSLNYDIIFVEGFKTEKFIPKVCFSNGCMGCVAHGDDENKIINYIEEEIEVEKILKKLPNFNCGECGHKNCEEMARAIYRGEDNFKNCRYWNPNAVISVRVNGKDIYMGKFAQDVVINTIKGLLSSFKGVKEIENVEIKIKKI